MQSTVEILIINVDGGYDSFLNDLFCFFPSPLSLYKKLSIQCAKMKEMVADMEIGSIMACSAEA